MAPRRSPNLALILPRSKPRSQAVSTAQPLLIGAVLIGLVVGSGGSFPQRSNQPSGSALGGFYRNCMPLVRLGLPLFVWVSRTTNPSWIATVTGWRANLAAREAAFGSQGGPSRYAHRSDALPLGRYLATYCWWTA